MSDLKKLVAQFMSELAKFEATTVQSPIAADEFTPEELADLTKIRNMGAKIQAKISKPAKIQPKVQPEPDMEMPAWSAAAPENNLESFESLYQAYLNDCQNGNLTPEKLAEHKKKLNKILGSTEKRLQDLKEENTNSPEDAERIVALEQQIASYTQDIAAMSLEACATCTFKYKVTDSDAMWNAEKNYWEATRTIEYCANFQGETARMWSLENVHQGGQTPNTKVAPERGIKKRTCPKMEGKDAATSERKAQKMSKTGDKITHPLIWEVEKPAPPLVPSAVKITRTLREGTCESSSFFGDDATVIIEVKKFPPKTKLRIYAHTNHHISGRVGNATLQNLLDTDLKGLSEEYEFFIDHKKNRFENDLTKPQSYEIFIEKMEK